MLTKMEQKSVLALRDKRERDRLGLYVVEGDKLVREALALGLDIQTVYGEASWLDGLPGELATRAPRVASVSPAELRRLSGQVTPNGALAVLRKPRHPLDWRPLERGHALVLEGIQDPGNLGSLLRVAAWFGVDDVVASPDGADPFQPKAVQASMGALFHVRVHGLDVAPFLADAASRGLPIYAAALGGASIYEADLEPRGLLVFGNESGGLSGESLARATLKLTIPAWGSTGPGRDSLNVAMAAAIVCSEVRRRQTSPASPGRARDRA